MATHVYMYTVLLHVQYTQRGFSIKTSQYDLTVSIQGMTWAPCLIYFSEPQSMISHDLHVQKECCEQNVDGRIQNENYSDVGLLSFSVGQTSWSCLACQMVIDKTLGVHCHKIYHLCLIGVSMTPMYVHQCAII